MEAYEPKVAEHKSKRAAQLAKLMDSYPIVGIVNVENIPAPQLQKMRRQLRSTVELTMAKKRIINIAIAEAEKGKPHFSELKKHMTGMPAIAFTKENPFKLASALRKSKSAAPAKPGQVAPRDITIPAGPTQFSPGPIISELSAIGLKTGVESGKVTIRQDHTAAREGEKISQKVAEVLAKLGVQPMEIGLDLVAIYEDGTVYTKEILSIDEQQYIDRMKQAAAEAQSLAVYIAYAAKETIKQLIVRAYSEAKGLALSKELMSDVYAHKLVVDAERQASAISSRLPEDALKPAEEAKQAAASETKPQAGAKPAEEKRKEEAKEERTEAAKKEATEEEIKQETKE
ncbi:50S ribosomal protein L10, partial [Candidatus Woesearchaeota archaeon]|nr:50S ribosomal protein L10 [Candidatus Woesearchaeota archaeon]